MRVKSNKLYIDYLDHTVSSNVNFEASISRLRYDLLLFSEEVLCLSVPACVKLDSTTNILMRLTPFWRDGKIKLILDHKHQNNPWNYFNNRKRVLEKGFDELDLINHFEYKAYVSPHTRYFYDTFINEEAELSKQDLFIDKIFDTDETFRQSIITQINNNADIICSNSSFDVSLHMGKIFNDLLIISEDRKSLFQRTAIEKKLREEFGATPHEISIISKMLDKGFAYANGISSYAAPLSLVTNRLTGKEFKSIIQSADKELYEIINDLGWSALYRLSINDTWLDFIDHLNRLLILYQKSAKKKDTVFGSFLVDASLTTKSILNRLYESAIESLQIELLKIGAVAIDVLNLKKYADDAIDYFISKSDYLDIVKEIDEFIPALKVVIRSLHRKYKDSRILLQEQGYLVSLDKEIF